MLTPRAYCLPACHSCVRKFPRKDDTASFTKPGADCAWVERCWSHGAMANVLPVAMSEGAIQPCRGGNQSEKKLSLSAL
jgi:hypothetical protein